MSLFDTFNQSPGNPPAGQQAPGHHGPGQGAGAGAGGGGGGGVDQKRQLTDFIKLHVYEDSYVDRQEERKILEYAISIGLGFDDGYGLLRTIAQEKGWVIEREAEETTKIALLSFAKSGGKVDKKEFTTAVSMLVEASRGRIKEDDARRRCKQMMLDNGWKAKEGGLFGSEWFSQIKL